MSTIRLLFVGDVVGVPGCNMFQKHIPALKQKYNIQAVVVNGENSAGNGRGITSRLVHSFKHNGANVVTSGNHIWNHKEVYEYLDKKTDLLRPANFPTNTPGTGVTTFIVDNQPVGVINLQGRVFMRELSACPFRTAESILTYLKTKTSVILVDFHAETSSEKIGLAHFLDGQVSAVFGTHTHVQTADERILKGGTAFITDAGMCGALNGMLGMKKEPIIEHFISQMPIKFEVDDQPPFVLCAVIVDIDTRNGKATSIERIKIIDDK